jgi:hypothetical protein
LADMSVSNATLPHFSRSRFAWTKACLNRRHQPFAWDGGEPAGFMGQ